MADRTRKIKVEPTPEQIANQLQSKGARKKKKTNYDAYISISIKNSMLDVIQQFCIEKNFKSFSYFFREAVVEYMAKNGYDISSLK